MSPPLQEAVRKGMTELFLKPSTSNYRGPLPVLCYQYSLRSVRWLLALASLLLRRARLRAVPSAAAEKQVCLVFLTCGREEEAYNRALWCKCCPPPFPDPSYTCTFFQSFTTLSIFLYSSLLLNLRLVRWIPPLKDWQVALLQPIAAYRRQVIGTDGISLRIFTWCSDDVHWFIFVIVRIANFALFALIL